MLVTSKGYPDYNTQAFLQKASNKAAGIYYLGDLDPYGFDILL
jgi:DNA topoisomerase VI subunit A